MRSSPRIAILVVLAAIGSAAGALAAVTGDAQVWLEAMAEAQSDGPVRYHYSMEMHGAGGQPGTVSLGGQVTQDRERMRSAMSNTTTMGGTELKTEMLLVSDGETMWIETSNPMMSKKQVMKMSVDQMKKMSESMGLPGGGGGSPDPLDQVEQMSRMYDMEVAAEDAETVTLRGKVSAEAAEKYGEQAAGPLQALQALGGLELVVDKQTGFPREMRVGGDPPAMVMRFEGYERLDDVAPETFHYTPPKGAMVMDMSVTEAR